MDHSPEDVLRLGGMVCDEVAEVTEAMSVSLFDNQAAFRDHLGKLWDIAKAEVSGPAPDLSTAFRKVLLGGSDPNKRSGPPNFSRPSTTGETGEQLKSTIDALLMTTLSPQFDIEERCQWRIKDHEIFSDRQWRSYLEELMNMSVNRVFFITEEWSGKYSEGRHSLHLVWRSSSVRSEEIKDALATHRRCIPRRCYECKLSFP
jgi:hypothetical protein